MNISETYAKGIVTFMGVELAVGPGALVPRDETELLGRAASAALQTLSPDSPRVIDMCCGVGNLSCALASRFPRLRVWASDVSEACVHLARENVQRLDMDGRVQIYQGDLFASLAGQGLEGTIDLIVCNPPYISQKRLESECAGLLAHEPREAFDGGPYGLSIHQRVISEALSFLRPDGQLFFEVGLGQAKQVKILFSRSRAFKEVGFVNDPAGDPRVVHARRAASQMVTRPNFPHGN
jgi:release factor glutamine methyltransferase